MNEKVDRQMKRSKSIAPFLAVSEAIFIGLNIVSFVLGYSPQVGFIIAGTLAIGFFWLFIQQKIIKETYKELLDYKFDNLEKSVAKSSDNLLENLTRESTELIDDNDFDITKVFNKTDEDLV